MIVERIALLLLFVAVTGALYLAWRCCLHLRFNSLAKSDAPEYVRRVITGGAPAILYFTTAECAQCRFQQGPVLDKISEQARIAVYTIDAVAQRELASFYGVMTVPSTVVLSPDRQPIAINHGLATAQQIDRQLAHLDR